MKVSEGIGWINGVWGHPSELTVPMRDQGLTLGDGIFETILILKGQPQLLNNHLNRWQKTAFLLGMASPPTKKFLFPLIKESIERTALTQANGVLRLNWSRGDSFQRGIHISTKKPNPLTHRFWLEVNPGEPSFNSVMAMISCHERRNAYSRMSHCKTFGYGQSIQAKHEAQISGYEEALLLSTNGDICCGTTANLLVKRKGEWLTPPLASGCLPGIMRQQGLDRGIIKEMKLRAEPEDDDEWLLINSLGCRPIKKWNNTYIKVFSNATNFWSSLL